MRPNTRLFLVILVLVGSAAYAVLVTRNPTIASAIAGGYVAILVSLLIAIQLWRRP